MTENEIEQLWHSLLRNCSSSGTGGKDMFHHVFVSLFGYLRGNKDLGLNPTVDEIFMKIKKFAEEL